MGMTPLAGLMMGTRCGDLDPSVVNYLKYTLNITGHELDEILNKKSGLLGISGVSSDKRDVEEAAAAGNKRATAGFRHAELPDQEDRWRLHRCNGRRGCHRLHRRHRRARRNCPCKGLPPHGLAGHPHRYREEQAPVGDVCEITAWGAKVRTLVIATDEELMIARDTKEVLEK